MIAKANGDNEVISTRQKIINCAVNLFAVKGYTETSIRDLAADVGLKGAAIYNHFQSKNAILEFILEDYLECVVSIYLKKDIPSILRENPTSDGILDCMQLLFPRGREEYYFKVLCVLMQEQYRNPIVRKFMAEQFIDRIENNVRIIIEVLKDLNVICQDIDPDYWVRTSSSLIYAFASRAMLGIGDSSPGFSGKGMAELLRSLYDMMLKSCAASPP